MSTSARTKDLHKHRLVVGLRKPTSLRNMLVTAKVAYDPNGPNRHRAAVSGKISKECTFDKCRVCPRLNKTDEIKSGSRGTSFSSKTNVTCRSSNLIYCITCKRCSKQYVGQTLRMLRERLSTHITNITIPHLNTDMGFHYNTSGHKGLQDMEIHIVDFIHPN